MSQQHDWLSQRGRADSRFRSAQLAKTFLASLASYEVERVLDFGCGSGNNFFYLQSLWKKQGQAKPVRWLGIDIEQPGASLAAQFEQSSIDFEMLDLALDLERLTPIGVAVTAAAFLDLTSELWLSRFAQRFNSVPILLAMTQVSQPDWYPVHDADQLVRQCVFERLIGDHGFGPAAGNRATEILSRELESRGCQIEAAATSWRLGPEDATLLEILIEGSARRLHAIGQVTAARSWEQRRKRELAQGELRMVWEHADLLSLPSGEKA